MRVLSIIALSVLLCSYLCSAAVNVYVCNSYPAQYVSISWGNVNSSRIAYQSCGTVTVDSAITTGQLWLWSTLTTNVSTLNSALAVKGTWCTDFNRNLIVAYEAAAGTLGITLPQQDGGSTQNCNTLPTGNAVRYIVNAACSVANFATVDVVVNTVLVKSGLNCTSGSNYVASVAAANSFFAATGALSFNKVGTNTSIETFSLTGVTNPAADQSDFVMISGDANNAAALWTFTTTTTNPTPTPSGAYKAEVQSGTMLAAISIIIAAMLTKFH